MEIQIYQAHQLILSDLYYQSLYIIGKELIPGNEHDFKTVYTTKCLYIEITWFTKPQ